MEPEKEQRNLAELIRKAGKAQRTGEFKFKLIEGFYATIAFASKFVMNQIREASIVTETNLRTNVIEETFDNDKLQEQYTLHLLKGWRGLTGQKLKNVIPGIGVADEDLEKEIPYDREIALALMEVSTEFENWVVGIATTVKNFTHVADRKEKELENLKN